MKTIPAKNIITSTKSRNWFGSHYNMNLYRGCPHGCIYCDSRSQCYGIENFDTVLVKENALSLIEKSLRGKIKTGVIGTGAMSDPYNPLEKKYELTRQSLEIIDKFRFGVAIATKSPLVTRDIDILKRIQSHSPVIIKMTITTTEERLCKIIEPNVASTNKRFEGIKALSDNGIFCGLLMMPILPFINDTSENIIELVHLSKVYGAKFIYPSFGLTLRDQQRDYFFQKLDEHFPTLKKKYMETFKNQYQCGSPDAQKLYQLFTEECKKNDILFRMPDIINAYQYPRGNKQLSFL
ncbi:MAG: radical SAM protein [Eubacteriaceae bacterium]